MLKTPLLLTSQLVQIYQHRNMQRGSIAARY